MITISPSSMNDFFSCPAKFQYRRVYIAPGSKDKALIDGNIVHDALEQGTPLEEISQPPRTWVKQVRASLRHYEYDIIQTERLEKFKYNDSITISRKIDAYAYLPDGTPVIIDYKTSGKMWPTIAGQAPQGGGFQANMYLIKPSNELNPFKGNVWPDQIHFVVVSKGGGSIPVRVHKYYRNPEGTKNMEDALELIAGAKSYPKNRGYGCDRCNYSPVCFDTSRKKLFKERGKKK